MPSDSTVLVGRELCAVGVISLEVWKTTDKRPEAK